MKRRVSFSLVLIIAFVFASVRAEATAGYTGYGRLIVQRSGNFGSHVGLRLSIDGRTLGNIQIGRRYNQPLSAGYHVLTVTSVPNVDRFAATSVRLNVQPDQTYVFMAMWDQIGGVVLRTWKL
jgi:hypothetical protein